MYSTGLAAILRFCTKSEGLGDFSQLNNETTRTLTSWPGSWESSGSLSELSTAAGPLLLLVLGPLTLLLLTPFDEHYTCIIPIKLSDYSRIMLYALWTNCSGKHLYLASMQMHHCMRSVVPGFPLWPCLYCKLGTIARSGNKARLAGEATTVNRKIFMLRIFMSYFLC